MWWLHTALECVGALAVIGLCVLIVWSKYGNIDMDLR